MVSARKISKLTIALNLRAQRLTASMVSAHYEDEDDREEQTVLNALRHQWFRHDPAKRLRVTQPQCSTPYGINGFGT